MDSQTHHFVLTLNGLKRTYFILVWSEPKIDSPDVYLFLRLEYNLVIKLFGDMAILCIGAIKIVVYTQREHLCTANHLNACKIKFYISIP